MRAGDKKPLTPPRQPESVKITIHGSVVESVRVRGGPVVQRQVLYLGEINDSEREAWCRSIEVLEGKSGGRQIALFAEGREVPALDCEVVRVQVQDVEVHAPRQWGACWLGLCVRDRLELGRFWGPRLPASRQGTRWLDILKVQVCYRLIDPAAVKPPDPSERIRRIGQSNGTTPLQPLPGGVAGQRNCSPSIPMSI